MNVANLITNITRGIGITVSRERLCSGLSLLRRPSRVVFKFSVQSCAYPTPSLSSMFRNALAAAVRPALAQTVRPTLSLPPLVHLPSASANSHYAFGWLPESGREGLYIRCSQSLTTDVCSIAANEVWGRLHRMSLPVDLAPDLQGERLGHSHSRRWYWRRDYRLCQRNLQSRSQGCVLSPEFTPLSDLSVHCAGILFTPISQSGHISWNVAMRQQLDIYASVVLCKSLPGFPTRHSNVDFAIIRENTEGEYSGLEHQSYPGVVESLKVSTRAKAERISRFAFDFALRNNRKVRVHGFLFSWTLFYLICI
jgi:Isocitrate/isopropylmalate dehydrogenase